MLELETALFGKLEVEETEVIHFPVGIPGFEEQRRFVVIKPDAELPFSYMQCVDEPHASFIVTDPFLFYPDYEFELPESTMRELQIADERDIAVWSIVTVKERLKDATLNLLAPIVIHVQKRLGKQVVLHNAPYTTRHKLIRGHGPGTGDMTVGR